MQDAEAIPEHLLIVLSCDPMRRLADALSLYGPFQSVFRLDVPRRRDELAAEFLTSQLKDLKRELEDATGRVISDQDLHQAIQALNHSRSLLSDISELRRSFPHLLPGSEFHALVRFCEAHHPDDVHQHLTQRLQELWNQSQHETGWKGPRLLLTGSVLEEADVLHRIEERGAHVVCDDTCSGEKDLHPNVDTQGPPLESLARRMLQRPPCPRMLGSGERIQRVAQLAENFGCDGVVAHTLKFCDLTQADLPRLEKTLTESGIPLLHLEQDSLSEDRGQLATRIQAFMETL
jgi:benzoyl-CoA reductase/2-hydroxyglutaryl-CoA dehydratase subunit BcrC/BadD/HgdB